MCGEYSTPQTPLALAAHGVVSQVTRAECRATHSKARLPPTRPSPMTHHNGPSVLDAPIAARDTVDDSATQVLCLLPHQAHRQTPTATSAPSLMLRSYKICCCGQGKVREGGCVHVTPLVHEGGNETRRSARARWGEKDIRSNRDTKQQKEGGGGRDCATPMRRSLLTPAMHTTYIGLS